MYENMHLVFVTLCFFYIIAFMLSNHLIQSRASAYFLIGAQAIFTLLVAGGFGFVGDFETASAVILGGVVCVLPNLAFAGRVFLFSGATQAKRIMNQFYKAEMGKWLLTFGLFAVIISVLKPAPLPFFAMYIAATMVIWFSPYFFKRTTRAQSAVPQR